MRLVPDSGKVWLVIPPQRIEYDVRVWEPWVVCQLTYPCHCKRTSSPAVLKRRVSVPSTCIIGRGRHMYTGADCGFIGKPSFDFRYSCLNGRESVAVVDCGLSSESYWNLGP